MMGGRRNQTGFGEHFEGLDEVSSEESAFQLEEVGCEAFSHMARDGDLSLDVL